MNKNKSDLSLWVLTFTLIGSGIIMMYSASSALSISEYGHQYYYFINQSVFAAIGIIFMLLAYKIDYHIWSRFAWLGYFVSVALLIAVHFFGVERAGAQRWLNLGIQFQPSEIAKISIIILFATLAVRHQKELKHPIYGLGRFLALLAGVVIFTLLQPHLSASIIIAVTGIAIIFVAGASVVQLIILALLGGLGVLGYAMKYPHVLSRLEVWWDPFSDFLDKGWQGSQSFIAIGSGGLFGLGFGQSKQKHLYLPEPANDFIYSVICEELGFVGGVFVALLFAYFIYKAYRVAFLAKDKFGMLLAVGIATKVATQTIVNLFVVTGIFPITGASLPFFSYGGTALVIQIAEIGILLNISKQGRST